MEFFFQILLVILLVLLNGYFVASEFSLVAVRKTRIAELAKKGSKNAKILQRALNELDNYISSTQLGITLASLALGWIGEPAVAHAFEPLFGFLPASAAFVTAHTLSVVIAFTIITILHIVIGELVPKSIALQKPEKISLLVITPLILFTRIFSPFIWVLNGMGQLVLQVFGFHVPTGHQQAHTEEEINMILAQSASEGEIPRKEVEMVKNVFQLGDTIVKYVMVPRTDILAFDVNTSLGDVISKFGKHPHSRFPVYENTIDSVIGFIHVKDIYQELIKKGESAKLSETKITRTIISVPEMKKIDAVLSDMRRKRVHIAVVADEFGGTAGLVTLEDIIESLVGEIEDEFDETIVNIARQKDGSYRVNGYTLLSEIQEKFHLPIQGQGYTTIAGLVFGLLGHEPKMGDTVTIGNLNFTIEKLEGKRIKTLRLEKVKKSN